MAFGILYLDALAIKNVAVTGVEGPFAFNHQELLFGRDATTWQSKNNLRPPSFSQVQASGPVINANYLVRSHASSSVSQASFRSALHESLLNRPGILNRNAPSSVENPNTIRTTEGVPELDIKTNDVRARTLSGTIFISGVESLDTHQRSKYRLRLVDADLQGLLLDLGETNTNVSGRLSIQCDLQGALTNTSTLEGQGRGWLRKANLYEVPAIIRLFRMLSVTPGQGAFDSADIQFGIDGERLPIHELVLDGDIVSMRGSGWVNMRRELHLDMYANVGRRGMIGAIFHPIAKSSAGKLWQIEVNGTTNDPQIRRPMPLMNKFDMVLPNNNNGSNP